MGCNFLVSGVLLVAVKKAALYFFQKMIFCVYRTHYPLYVLNLLAFIVDG